MFVQQVSRVRHVESGFYLWVEGRREAEIIVISEDGESPAHSYTVYRSVRELYATEVPAEGNPCRKVAIWKLVWDDSWNHVTLEHLGNLRGLLTKFIEFYQLHMAAKCVVDDEPYDMPYEISVGSRFRFNSLRQS